MLYIIAATACLILSFAQIGLGGLDFATANDPPTVLIAVSCGLAAASVLLSMVGWLRTRDRLAVAIWLAAVVPLALSATGLRYALAS